MEIMEIAKDRLLKSNLKEAIIRTGKSQTKIRIWSVLEMTALEVLKDLTDKVVDMVTENEETANIRASLEWLDKDDDTLPEGWKEVMEEGKAQ